MMASGESDAKRLEFLMNSYQTHVEYICNRQERRFEILRYAFIGLFVYFAFIFSGKNNQLICGHPGEFIALVPSFLLLLAIFYIELINRNIEKHGAYIKYLFDHGLKEFGLGTNHFQNFLINVYYPHDRRARFLEKIPLHPSQIVLVGMMISCVILYGYLILKDGIDSIMMCQS